MKPKENWYTVVKALEKIIPYYEEVNDFLSLGYAEKARTYAVNSAEIESNSLVLDAGIGPGSLSKIVLSRFNPSLLVGFDFSTEMLKASAKKLETFNVGDENNIQFVRGIFEYLPFRSETFNQVFASFSLRDSISFTLSLREFCRVCKSNGQLTIVEVGKPDNRVFRGGIELYMRFLMPLVAKLLIRRKIKGNPWCLLTPTYKELPTNKSLKNRLQETFSGISLKEFLFGAIVVLQGRKVKRDQG